MSAPLSFTPSSGPFTANMFTQQAFQRALVEVENLREQLRQAETTQTEARRRYWQQVGPLADAVVTARQALFAPLEDALLWNAFSRDEERQIMELLVANAQDLQERFGVETLDILLKYAPPRQAEPVAAPDLAAEHEPERPRRRQTKAERAAAAEALQAEQDQQSLLVNTKTVYRRLARANHPDLERDPARAAEKTTRMQRITQAYEANDLYTLLQLLAEDEAEPTDDSLLIRYTEALRRQLHDLRQQLNEVKFGPWSFLGSTPKKQEAGLRQLKRQLRTEAESLAQVARQLHTPTDLRALLRELAAAHATL
ncbi:J domain-containing protein [Hymenobacter aerilatus]|uniref:J domain-containing protein n=1 Tax=Hymenobacter aerilatus TaxID=2932251 RepID=A0A8T9T063_9BACT|nr:J domain-containing protein [Hymenobacter aerilatus]UOR06373.1 J domain-containing protein [Hymenobacter aerilatus]